MLRWKGVTYLPGVAIPEDLYEEYIDRAYGRGMSLRDTLIWNDRYERGFVTPDWEGGWYAFAYDGRKHYYLGQFGSEQLIPDEDSWEDHEYEMLLKADTSVPKEAIGILKDLYLDGRSDSRPSRTDLAIAGDEECIRWFIDYWTFVRWNEHGNQCSVSEIGFDGFIGMILRPAPVSEYLKEADCDTARELDRRLAKLHRKYGDGRKR